MPLTNPSAEPSLGALVVSYNSGQQVLNALAALRRQPVPLQEVVVVDSGSNDGSPHRVAAEYPHATIITLADNPGLPVARNTGLRAMRSNLVVMLDADVYVDDRCLEHLLAAHRDTGAAVICPRVLLPNEGGLVQADGAEAHFVGTMQMRHAMKRPEALPSERSEVGGCIGAAMLVHRQTVLDAGGFDERFFFYFEDLEFSMRMWLLGHRIVCEPAAVVRHDRGTGTPGLSYRGAGQYPARRVYLTVRNRLLTMLTHLRWRTLMVLAPALAVYEAVTLVVVLFRGWIGPWSRAMAWPLTHLDETLERRRWVQQRRQCADRKVLVGGSLPLASGLATGPIARRAVACLSWTLNAYWRLARRLIG